MTPKEYLETIQKTWNEFAEFQRNMLQTFAAMSKSFAQLNVMNSNMAVFRAKVQSGGRISIPEADRQAMKINDGDIVKVILVKEG
ncbi:hypothetical protein DRP07_06135 [Archaeoglobales archaeon]|nr:MAG: hypothetical protein DRP07_06135 [Archaeoglobales archaeon]